MLDSIRNFLFNQRKYRVNSEGIIIACFFNPENSAYRLKAFLMWYESIKHMPHRIVECSIGKAKRQLPNSPYIDHIQTNSLLWHKEALLNYIIRKLPKKYKYVAWVDTDIHFDNLNWFTDGCKKLETDCTILQPFEYVIHLEKDELKPSFDVEEAKKKVQDINFNEGRRIWRSFCSNVGKIPKEHKGIYYLEGVCGFVWMVRRDVLDRCLLHDEGLIGSSDHIMSHAAVGDYPSKCINKSFKDDLNRVYDWSAKFFRATGGKVGYISGTIYHTWHGDLKNRQYLKRVQDWQKVAKTITKRDMNGLFIHENDPYLKEYFANKEIAASESFLISMLVGYVTDSSWWGYIIGGNWAGAKLGDQLNPTDGDKPPSDCNCGY